MQGFWNDQSGAVTVDWVVLSAAIVGLGIGSAAVVQRGSSDLGAGIQSSLSNARVAMLGARDAIRWGFDDVAGLTRTGWGWRAVGEYDGWEATSANKHIEIVESGHRGVVSPDGRNWVDLDASPGNITLSRVLDTVGNGQTQTLSFNAADSGAVNGVEVYFGGELVSHVNPTSSQFESHSFALVGGSGDGSNRLELRGTGPENGIGVSLHDIRLE